MTKHEGARLTDIEPSPLSGTYADIALNYIQQGWAPIPVKGKFPPISGATGRDGVVSRAKIDQWRNDPEWADQNIAVRAEGFVGIDVDAYDNKHGGKQLAELEQALGALPVTISSTSRGASDPSRTRFYSVPEGVEFLSKAAPDIDVIQRGHRYSVVFPSWHPGTGEPYVWYNEDDEPLEEIPNVEDMERLPEAWLEFLTVDPTAKREGFNGSIEEWLQNCEPGEPSSKVRSWINAIPEDHFSHVDVVRITYALVRLGSERETGIRQAIETLYFTWLRGEFDEPKYEKELSVAIQGAIRKAGQFGPTPDTLPRYFDASALLPKNMPKQLDELLYKSTVEQIPDLITELYGHLESERDIAAIVWQRASSLGMDFPSVWQMVLDGKVTPQDSPEEKKKARHSLLSKAERDQVALMENWVTKYLDYARTTVPDGYLNQPYHQAAAWVAASMIFGPHGRIAGGAKPMPLNVWFVIPGESSTGKNLSMNALKAFLDAYFEDESPYDIGASGSMVGFQEILLERDKRPTLMSEDEISGIFTQWMDQRNPAFSGMPDRLTSWYEGNVTSMPRRGRPDLAGSAVTHLCMYFMGTPSRMFSVLTRDHFATGFLARCLWAVGDPPADVIEYKMSTYDGIQVDAEGNSVSLQQWGQQLRAEVQSLGSINIINFSKDARARVTRAGNKVMNLFRKHADSEALHPAATRLMDSVKKCCGLLALSSGRTIVEESDVIYVLNEAEQWLENVEKVVAQISSTPHRQKMDRVIRYMKSARSVDIHEGKISELLGEDMQKINQVMASLLVEKKVSKKEEGPNTFYRLEKDNG